MNLQTLWKAALVQLISVGVLFAALALTLPRDFFVDWGWITGPAAWMLCAAVTARVLSLPLVPALTGAVLAGLPALLAVLLNAHSVGTVLAVGLFAIWCARLPRDDVAAIAASSPDSGAAGALSIGEQFEREADDVNSGAK